MGLNIYERQAIAAPQLNDTFLVKIKWNKSDTEYEELPSCIGFTAPMPKWKEELQTFGNNSYIFLIPDYDSVDDVQLEFLEYADLRISDKIAKMLSYVFNFEEDKWWYLERNIYELVVEIYDNNFSNVSYTYVFKYLKITKYDNYELNYSDDTPVKWNISLNFMHYQQYAGGYNVGSLATDSYYSYDSENAAAASLPPTPIDLAALSTPNSGFTSSMLSGSALSAASYVPPYSGTSLPTVGVSGGDQGPVSGQPVVPENPPAQAIAPAPTQGKRRIMSDEEYNKWKKEFGKGNSAGALKMSVQDYLDFKYTVEQKIKAEIEKRIATGSKDFEKHVGKNGVVFYTVKKTSSGKNVNRSDDNSTKAEDDVMMHTVGSIMNNLDAITKQMGTGGESMVLFTDFALVKEEAFSKGRVYSAAAGNDRVGSGVNSHMFGIERNTGSGIFDNKKKSGVIHQTDRNVQLTGDWKNDAASEGLSLTKTAAGSDKQISMGYLDSEIDVMAAVFSEMNKKGTGKYNFDNAKVYGSKTVKEDKNKTLTMDVLKGGTVLAAHDSVSNKGKNGEAGVDTLKELREGLAKRMKGGKIDESYYSTPAPIAATEQLLAENPAPVALTPAPTTEEPKKEEKKEEKPKVEKKPETKPVGGGPLAATEKLLEENPAPQPPAKVTAPAPEKPKAEEKPKEEKPKSKEAPAKAVEPPAPKKEEKKEEKPKEEKKQDAPAPVKKVEPAPAAPAAKQQAPSFGASKVVEDAEGNKQLKNADGSTIYKTKAGNYYTQDANGSLWKKDGDKERTVEKVEGKRTYKNLDGSETEYNVIYAKDSKTGSKELISILPVAPKKAPEAVPVQSQKTGEKKYETPESKAEYLAVETAKKDIEAGTYKDQKGENYMYGYTAAAKYNITGLYTKLYTDYMNKNAPEKPKQ